MKKTNDEIVHQILVQLKELDYIKPEEIPNIDLYMDQVTTFMDKHLASTKRYPDDKLLTKTMINNYTKNNLLPSPTKKKYSKEHLFLLIYIYYFKGIISIGDIEKVLQPLTKKYFHNETKTIDLEKLYETIVEELKSNQITELTKDIVKKYQRSKKSFSFIEEEKEQEFLNNFSLLCMLSFDVYVKKVLIERIIDSGAFSEEE